MNRKQKVFFWLGLITFVFMGLIPPWIYVSNTPRGHYEKSGGYYPIFAPPAPQISEYGEGGVRLDVSRLLIQWVVVALVTSALLVTFKGSPTQLSESQPLTHDESTDAGPAEVARPAQPDSISELLRLKRQSEVAQMATEQSARTQESEPSTRRPRFQIESPSKEGQMQDINKSDTKRRVIAQTVGRSLRGFSYLFLIAVGVKIIEDVWFRKFFSLVDIVLLLGAAVTYWLGKKIAGDKPGSFDNW